VPLSASPRTVHPAAPLQVLFVCLGNICRSPLAEGIFRAQVMAAGLSDFIHCDSAGTGDWHVGELPDPRTRQVARQRGLELTHRARQFTPSDFRRFDYVLCMDANNLRGVMEQSGGAVLPVVTRMRAFDPAGEGDVPDPYFGELDGFEQGYALLERVCAALLAELRRSHGL